MTSVIILLNYMVTSVCVVCFHGSTLSGVMGKDWTQMINVWWTCEGKHAHNGPKHAQGQAGRKVKTQICNYMHWRGEVIQGKKKKVICLWLLFHFLAIIYTLDVPFPRILPPQLWFDHLNFNYFPFSCRIATWHCCSSDFETILIFRKVRRRRKQHVTRGSWNGILDLLCRAIENLSCCSPWITSSQ